MNTNKMKLALGLFVFSCFIIPVSSEAYFSTTQTATKINEHTTLFTVTYKFGFLNRELYMPIIAERNLGTTSSRFSVGYTLLDTEEAIVNAGSATSIVLTTDEDVVIKDTRYYLPQGKSAEFTLVTLVTTPTEVTTDASLLVSHLPFIMVKEGEEIPARLNPSEMQYYRTPTVEL